MRQRETALEGIGVTRSHRTIISLVVCGVLFDVFEQNAVGLVGPLLHGNEKREFDVDGPMTHRHASIDDQPRPGRRAQVPLALGTPPGRSSGMVRTGAADRRAMP
ncbi:hypothetical protein [Variovorax sp. PvP013]|uniref:hypothetical protein n=1 Tax=Variovorax sp. PvP013 TaxID=3156435 RepID=UPI003D194D52